MTRMRSSCSLVATSLVLMSAGCGGKDQPVKVSGIVTLDGQPVGGAMVTFIPEAGTGRYATGQTKSDGTFRLTTLKPDDGAIPGDYKVTVDYVEGVDAPPAQNMEEAMQGVLKAQQQQKKKKPKYVIPPKYKNPVETELRQKVPPSEGKVTLALTSR